MIFCQMINNKVNDKKNPVIYHLLHGRHYSKCFIYIYRYMNAFDVHQQLYSVITGIIHYLNIHTHTQHTPVYIYVYIRIDNG